MFVEQAVFQQEPAAGGGLRTRKKLKTRMAIENAALKLFGEQGYDATTVEQIAEEAEVSITTLFRYFRGKSDIVLKDQDMRLPDLCAAIARAPRGMTELEALRRALHEAWVPHVDREHTRRLARALSASPVLRGLSLAASQRWLEPVGATLAARRGDPQALQACTLVARLALNVFGHAIAVWIARDMRDDFGPLIDEGFDTVWAMCRC